MYLIKRVLLTDLISLIKWNFWLKICVSDLEKRKGIYFLSQATRVSKGLLTVNFKRFKSIVTVY